MHVNGKLCSSENIADVAGLSAAYDAYRISLGGKEAPTAQGLTGDQQFFVSFAQSWRTKIREAAARARLLTDGHAPAKYRADTVRNLDPWYAAFAVKAGREALSRARRSRPRLVTRAVAALLPLVCGLEPREARRHDRRAIGVNWDAVISENVVHVTVK